MCDTALGHVNVEIHHISLLNDEVGRVQSTPSLGAPTERQIASAENSIMITENLTEPAAKELPAPILFFIKKDSWICFFVDYGELNIVTIWDWYLLPCMDKCITSLGEGTVLSLLHANSEYW